MTSAVPANATAITVSATARMMPHRPYQNSRRGLRGGRPCVSPFGGLLRIAAPLPSSAGDRRLHAFVFGGRVRRPERHFADVGRAQLDSVFDVVADPLGG